jgi:hypothetical protein
VPADFQIVDVFSLIIDERPAAISAQAKTTAL